MATRISDTPVDRGDGFIVALMRLGVLALVVLVGTVCGLTSADIGLHLPIAGRALAGLGFALIVTGLIAMPTWPKRWWTA